MIDFSKTPEEQGLAPLTGTEGVPDLVEPVPVLERIAALEAELADLRRTVESSGIITPEETTP